MIFVCGPGHGAPAVLSNLYVEGSLCKFYQKYDHTQSGVKTLVRTFSWPPTVTKVAGPNFAGFPSHTNALLPGAIHEGGELGYSLSVSFGAVMDHPDLIVTCLVGGEAALFLAGCPED
jgi:xylulose-5-phosphate/fructose-6-phosphate phosphoketolase